VQAASFQCLKVRDRSFEPALFCAPMAEVTHCAFRRVVARRFGGCGAFYTEMISGRGLLQEDPLRSPYLRRSAGEPRLIYQLMLNEHDPVERIVDRLLPLDPDGLDLNLGCHAPMVRRRQAGSRLFMDRRALESVLRRLRRAWGGLLSVKMRLGERRPGWRALLEDRIRLLEDCGVDLLAVHLRFFEDRFKRPARHDLLPWIASLTRLPVLANGDIVGPETVAAHPDRFRPAAGLMIGRAAAVRPWIFAAWRGPVSVDYAGLWREMCEAVEQDFPPERALPRVKIFTRYFSRNFRFGHVLAVAVQNAADLEAARDAAKRFFADDPEPVAALTPTSL